ncbi:putative secreted protein (Por secretion system target) [Larkinella arboricola]|uniref:Putative secreted protein (Por secretion system target) n=1 Tax=Larkinella arboricola TaxID=643671 RepID=A0A327WFF0_LARAB|nr:T9SS type A sorting domain-containing protein [Larkinella arboricola]RAJ90019.1 putative secreted protein (Por secretion system target) [Larkinella arboricola]
MRQSLLRMGAALVRVHRLSFFLTVHWRHSITRYGQTGLLVIGLWGSGWGQCFLPALNLNTAGHRPAGVVIGDFNGDRRPDLAVTNSGSNTVTLLLNNGQGSFSQTISHPVDGLAPGALVSGDFNQDGWLDVAVANRGSNNVSVLLGNRQGAFTKAINLAVGERPQAIAVGDFNADQLGDLAVVNYTSNTVSVLLNQGQGRFAPAVCYQVYGRNPNSVAVADFNGDTRPDVAVSTNGYSSENVSVLFGNGQGGLGKGKFFNVGYRPGSIAVADFNGDSLLDLAVTHGGNFSDPYYVGVLLGKGQGEFGPITSFEVGASPQQVAVGDLDGDHRSDLVVANNESNTLSLLYNCPTSSLPSVVDVSLIDAGDGQLIGPLTDGAQIDLRSFSASATFSIQANTSATTVSVKFVLSGPQSHTQVESVPPYALLGDFPPGTFKGWKPIAGSYRLQVTPYAGLNASGPAGQSLLLHFTVINSPAILGLQLLNADNGNIVEPLTDGQVVNLDALPTRVLTIQAQASAGTRSVRFNLDGVQHRTQTESVVPFTLFGNTDHSFRGWTPPLGRYSLSVTPFSQAAAGGSQGALLTISFTVIDQPAGSRLGVEGQQRGLQVHPNPFKDSFTLEQAGPADGARSVVLYDGVGRKVYEQRVESQQLIQLGAGLAPGIYLLEVGEGPRFQRQKLLKIP